MRRARSGRAGSDVRVMGEQAPDLARGSSEPRADDRPPPVRALIAQLPESDRQAAALVQTHISWVVLAGPFAYKLKKPVSLGFLDFSTLEKRHDVCRREVELNRRLTQRLAFNVGLRWARIAGLAAREGDYTREKSLRATVTYALSPDTTMTFGLRRQLLDSNVRDAGRETGGLIGIGHRF